MALAALALAGPAGLSREDFFARVYGFAFVPRRHQAVLDMLVHRMRARLGPRGALERRPDGGAMVLEVSAPLAIPDPRCALGAAERVLWTLARLGAASAQEAAAALRMPLRAVQNVLRELVEEGACSQIRSGRQLHYRVRETTFTSLVPRR